MLQCIYQRLLIPDCAKQANALLRAFEFRRSELTNIGGQLSCSEKNSRSGVRMVIIGIRQRQHLLECAPSLAVVAAPAPGVGQIPRES
jgi:hypothetical protein